MSQDTPQDATDAGSVMPASLEKLSSLLGSREHRLARGGDADLAAGALQATKDICDLGIAAEARSHPHIHPFLASIVDQATITLRSAAQKDEELPEQPTPAELLPYTPLSMLTVDGMDPEQVWSQLELRADGLCRIIKEVAPPEGDDEDGSIMGWEEEEDDEEEDGSDEDMTIEEWNRMMADEGYEEGMSDEGSGDSDEDGYGVEPDSDEEMSYTSGEGDEEEAEEEEEGSEDGSVDLEGSGDELEGAAGDDDDEAADASDASDSGYAAGPSKPRKALHPTLDDEFFSIDDFNRQTEEMEAGRLTSGALGGDEDEEAELDDVGAMFLEEGDGDDDGDIMFADFFDAPRRVEPAPKDKNGKKVLDGKKKKKSRVKFADDLEEEEDEVPEEEEDPSRGVMDRVKADLFDDSEDEGDEAKTLSTHERRQKELADQIAQLEQEAIGPKDWTLLGEASGRKRPENSLLEEDLDFEHTAKFVPTVTEETVATLEELIKKRILDGNFDSPVRVRAYEPTPFLPSRFFELDDKQSSKSLAQIYEDDYTAAATGGKVVDARDEKLRREHEEIEKAWNDVCYKLDALSSLNFVPKAPKAQITTIDNIATTSMESALPSTQSAGSMLAPQELFAGPKAADLQARSEQTPDEARRARGKARKTKKAERARLASTADLYSRKKSVKQQKDEALQNLVKTGKGVTVLGKGAKEDFKRRRRDDAAATPDAKRLKL